MCTQLTTKQQNIKIKISKITREKNESSIRVGDFNTLLSEMDRVKRQKINKDIVKLNNIISGLDIVDIYRVFHPTVAEHTFFSSSNGTSWATGRP